MLNCNLVTSKFRFYELKSIKSDGHFIQLHQQVNQGRQKRIIFRFLGQIESLKTEKRLASGRDTQSTRALIWQHFKPAAIRQIFPSASERNRSVPPQAPPPFPFRPRAFLKLNFIENKKVIGHPYVKFHDLQLLFETFFDISYRL